MTFMSRCSPVGISGAADVLVCEERWRFELGCDVTASLCGLVGNNLKAVWLLKVCSSAP